MNKKYATSTVGSAVEAILYRGAEKLYDKYLEHKLPNHARNLNEDQFQSNINMISLRAAKNQKMEVVATRIAQNIPADNFAAKRISIKRHSLQSSAFNSNKESSIEKSTKYQTVILSQRTINQNANTSKEIDESMLLQQESFKKSPLFIRSQRPSTMQVGRGKIRDDNTIGGSKVVEVEQKRAATCNVRKRKSFVASQAQKKRFVKLHEDIPLYIQEDMHIFNKIRRQKDQRDYQSNIIERHHAQQTARLKMKQLKAKQDFELLKTNLKGKSQSNPPITNFQNESGQMIINGRQINPQTHIIQLQFNPEQERLQSTIESKYSDVSSTKTKSFFSSKLSKKKTKITDEQFTNNGSRQTSSIPFVTLSYGIVISEDGLQAMASRRRPQKQLTKSKYVQQQSNKFKSHIPMVNSARINILSIIDAEPTARSSIIEQRPISIEKNLETTIESNLQRSLLWNPKGKSQGKSIRVSNRQILQREVIESKLALAH